MAPLKVPGLYMGPLLVVSACISCLPPNLHPLLGFLPNGVRRAVLPFHHTPVGPSVCTEAGCRPALFTPGPACLFPLDYIDNFIYIWLLTSQPNYLPLPPLAAISFCSSS